MAPVHAAWFPQICACCLGEVRELQPPQPSIGFGVGLSASPVRRWVGLCPEIGSNGSKWICPIHADALIEHTCHIMEICIFEKSL